MQNRLAISKRYGLSHDATLNSNPQSGDEIVLVTSALRPRFESGRPGRFGITGRPDVETRRVLAELQASCRARWKGALGDSTTPRDIRVGPEQLDYPRVSESMEG